ncbi:hypothetical protein BDZ91DRAFT_774805 [Kalaharituber pfeilii]|nr:hypothetical protein BDZ91DRAFT_774805 [Kalaharituber pfeilii]
MSSVTSCQSPLYNRHSAFRFPLFVITVLLFLPIIVGQPPTSPTTKRAGVASARATSPSKRWQSWGSWRIGGGIVNKRQTIDEIMIEADEYEWGGEGDGADVCKRWSHQSALVSNTVYIYGGQSKTRASQNDHMWNSNFLSLSLENSFEVGRPPVKSISQKSAGPPPVANGYLFTSLTGSGGPKLYLYGGLFSDKPHVRPSENSVWVYDMRGSSWSGINKNNFVISDDTEQKYIDRAAEGAGVSIPERGLGFYFGGHLDGYTTRGWSQDIPRVYLKSMVELRFPGGTEGKIDEGYVGFRNVSEGGGLDKAGVPERADGVLLFVPWGKEGLLVGIGGGRNETFTQLNIVDIYDISTSTWSRQATSGPTPKYRVNPCAVVASAPDGSSHNIYLYGGQNLVPYGDQIQYDDMWILSIPAFTWIEVDMKGQNNPPARAGHSCEIWGRQMIIIGGYVTKELSCDSPGIYVFDATGLEWKTKFIGIGDANGGANDSDNGGSDGGNSGGGGDDNEYDDGLEYQVPNIVQEIIGGDGNGGATITKPVVDPDDDSPLETGGEVTYTYSVTVKGPEYTYTHTVTQSDGSVTTETSTGGGEGGDGDNSRSRKGPNIAAIVGGVVGGLVALVILIFIGAFIVYKRKIRQLREQRLQEIEERKRAGGAVAPERRRESVATAATTASAMEGSSTDELLEGAEPSFWGVLLSPRRSLRVVNS